MFKEWDKVLITFKDKKEKWKVIKWKDWDLKIFIRKWFDYTTYSLEKLLFSEEEVIIEKRNLLFNK